MSDPTWPAGVSVRIDKLPAVIEPGEIFDALLTWENGDRASVQAPTREALIERAQECIAVVESCSARATSGSHEWRSLARRGTARCAVCDVFNSDALPYDDDFDPGPRPDRPRRPRRQ